MQHAENIKHEEKESVLDIKNRTIVFLADREGGGAGGALGNFFLRDLFSVT